MAFRSRDIISLKDFNGEEIEYIVDKALEIKKALKDERSAKEFA